PMNLWGFSRLHPSDIEAAVLRRLIDSCPNIVAIKAEGGFPGIMGFVECYRLFGREVIVTCPIVHDMVALAQLAPMQFTGTSNTDQWCRIFSSCCRSKATTKRRGSIGSSTRHFTPTAQGRRPQPISFIACSGSFRAG